MTVLPTIRPAASRDASALRALALDNGLFAPEEMGDFDEMLGGFLDGSLDGHSWVVAVDDRDTVAGGAYVAPEPFSDRVWNLYFLAVRLGLHRDGGGGALVDFVETALRRRGEPVARVLIVETSSTGAYAQARAFYEKQGFDEEARIREFYGPGDDKVVYWKALSTPASGS